MTTYAALIPANASDIYPTFGIDIVEAGEAGEEMQPEQWIEGGDFPETAADIKHRAEELAEAAGWRIDWTQTGGRFDNYGASYVQYPAERIHG